MWRFRSFLLIVSVILYTLVLGLAAVAISPLDRNGNRIQRIAVFWARLIMWTNRIRVHLRTEGELGAGPYVIVSNHQSLLDIPALLVSLPFNFKMVAKKELFRIPVFGWGMRVAGYIEVDREDTRRAIRGMSDADRNLREGRSIVVFPEGTRSRDGNLLPLKKGAFVIALKNRVPVLPCVVHGSFLLLPKGTLRMGKSSITVCLGRPVSTEGLGHEHRDIFRARVETWMKQALAELNEAAGEFSTPRHSPAGSPFSRGGS
jgi:1-acyl-sn-glycerol-3-phosphate acyltransferase